MTNENKNESEAPTPVPKAKGAVNYLVWIIGLVGVSGALAPWFDPFHSVELLIPDSLWPKPIASVVFPLALVAALGFHRRTSQERMRKFLLRWIFVFVFVLLTCFLTMQVFRNHWQPDAAWEILIHPVWIAFYLLVFCSTAFVMVLGAYLATGNDA